MRRSDYCRLCTKLSSSNVHIFEERGHKLMLHLKILKHSGIVVTEHDPLPKYVCIVCVGKLDFVERFFTDCKNAQVFFRRDQSWKLNVPSGSIGADCFLQNTDHKNDSVSVVDDDDKADINVRDPFDISVVKISPHEYYEDCKITEVSVENIISNNSELQKNDGKVSFISNCDEFNNGTLDAKDAETNLENCLIDDNVIVIDDDLSNKTHCATESDEHNNFSVVKINAVLEKVVTGDVPSRSNSVIDECSPDRGTSVLKISENLFNEKEKFLGSTVLHDNRLDYSSTVCERFDNQECNRSPDVNEKADSDDEVSCVQEEFEDDPENSDENSCSSNNDDSPLNVVNKLEAVYVDNAAVTSKIDVYMNDNDENPLNVINKLEVVDNNKDVTSNIDLYMCNVEKLNMNNLMSESFSRYFDCAENILKGKCSIMPYFIKWPRPGTSDRIGFKCFICTKYCYSRKVVMDHLYNHLKLICQFCRVVFRLKPKFKKHLLKKHYFELKNKKLKCSDCDEKYSDIDLYLSHVQVHCDYCCGLCPYITKNPNSFLIHVKEKHSEGKNNCNDCSLMYFDDEQSFKEHILNIRKEKHVCSSCGMIFHSEFFLKIHYEIYGMTHGASSSFTEENLSKDNSCNEVKLRTNRDIIKYFQDILSKKIPLEKLQISKKEVLGQNLSHGFECPFTSCKKVVGLIEEKVFKHIQTHLLLICYKCCQLFKDTKRYVNHIQQHISYSYFSCCICNNIKFDGLTRYISHVRDHICNRVCLYCFEVFSDRNERVRHTTKNHKDKIRGIMCDQCGKKLKDNQALQTHINSIHAVVKINMKKVCPTCGKCNRTLCCPLGSDSKEKEEFICAYCSKIFLKKMSLETHILAHMNEKRFACKYCIDKRFNRKTSLDKHVKDFHTERKWKCMFNDCLKSFTFKSALETHMKAAHKIGLLK
ncbi:uncharacterized protein LOC142329696 isoform X2 [Lycorma delicatula]|uniref:uncharacterized protein LOC142329696 isoform X2 n=1 Tax=Lycorma delicatula TaxID=130591 RepID=UPI003F50ED38